MTAIEIFCPLDDCKAPPMTTCSLVKPLFHQERIDTAAALDVMQETESPDEIAQAAIDSRLIF